MATCGAQTLEEQSDEVAGDLQLTDTVELNEDAADDNLQFIDE